MIDHCIAKIGAIVAEGRDDRRSLLQLGYNLGRLGELTGLGRELFWDRWKGPVADWDLAELRILAQDLQQILAHPKPKSDPIAKAFPGSGDPAEFVGS